MLYSPLSFAICTVIVYYNPFCNFMKLLYNVVNDIQVIYVYITKKKKQWCAYNKFNVTLQANRV